MADQQCRVTVVGERRRVDVAVPAAAPITEYVDSLARMCGQDNDDMMPEAWSLAAPGKGVLPLSARLSDVDAVDGQIFYLADVTSGEFDEPTVLDIEEFVDDLAERDGGALWNAFARASTTICVGIGWLVALALVSALLVPTGGALFASLGLAVGVVPPALALLARQQRWPVSVNVRLAMALSAVPVLAANGLVLSVGLFGPSMAGVGACTGAVLGAILAVSTVPCVLTVDIGLLSGVALVLSIVLRMLDATGIEVMAGIAVTGCALLLVGSWVTGRVVGLRWAPDPGGDLEKTRLAMRYVRWLFFGWTAVSALTVGIGIIALSVSTDVYAQALAGCLAVALLCRAGLSRLLGEALPVLVAATAGLFGIVLNLPIELFGNWPFAQLVVLTIGVVVLLLGMVRSVQREPRAHGWLNVVVNTCLVATVPLLLGVYGVFGQLLSIGHRL